MSEEKNKKTVDPKRELHIKITLCLIGIIVILLVFLSFSPPSQWKYAGVSSRVSSKPSDSGIIECTLAWSREYTIDDDHLFTTGVPSDGTSEKLRFEVMLDRNPNKVRDIYPKYWGGTRTNQLTEPASIVQYRVKAGQFSEKGKRTYFYKER